MVRIRTVIFVCLLTIGRKLLPPKTLVKAREIGCALGRKNTMVSNYLYSGRNGLLGSLSERDHALLKMNLELVPFPVRQQLDQPNRPSEYVYFPESGIVSVVAVSSGTESEVGIVAWPPRCRTATR